MVLHVCHLLGSCWFLFKGVFWILKFDSLCSNLTDQQNPASALSSLLVTLEWDWPAVKGTVAIWTSHCACIKNESDSTLTAVPRLLHSADRWASRGQTINVYVLDNPFNNQLWMGLVLGSKLLKKIEFYCLKQWNKRFVLSTISPRDVEKYKSNIIFSVKNSQYIIYFDGFYIFYYVSSYNSDPC